VATIAVVVDPQSKPISLIARLYVSVSVAAQRFRLRPAR
jgi:hypothetical protein